MELEVEVGSVSSLTEVQSGTKPKWLANGTTYILIAIKYELYLTTGFECTIIASMIMFAFEL